MILCGDAQTLRNPSDLHCLAVPDKYKQLGDFHRYYNGQRKAPILTLLIGGNHEASNYLWELYYGGWVAPNIYFLGEAGCVEVGGLTIAGVSGIYKSHDFTLGRFESMPYNGSTVRSVYHTRCYDTFRLHLLSHLQSIGSCPDIVLSHDWPNTIEQHGDVRWLMKKKPFFRDEIGTKTLGSPPLMDLLHDLKPKYWFSAHLHVRFAALVRHGEKNGGEVRRIPPTADAAQTENAEEVMIYLDDEDDALQGNEVEIDIKENNGGGSGEPETERNTEAEKLQEAQPYSETRFLALSKCLEGQDFLQIIDVPAPFDNDTKFQNATDGNSSNSKNQPSLRFSASWLAILRATHPLLSLERNQIPLPSLDDEGLVNQLKKEHDWIQSNILAIPTETGHPLDILATQQFVQTAPSTLDPNAMNMTGLPSWYTNPQTVNLCNLLQIENRINAPPPTIPQQPPTMASAHPLIPQFLQPPQLQQPLTDAALAPQVPSPGKDEHDLSNSDEIVVTLSDDEEENMRWKEGTG